MATATQFTTDRQPAPAKKGRRMTNSRTRADNTARDEAGRLLAVARTLHNAVRACTPEALALAAAHLGEKWQAALGGTAMKELAGDPCDHAALMGAVLGLVQHQQGTGVGPDASDDDANTDGRPVVNFGYRPETITEADE